MATAGCIRRFGSCFCSRSLEIIIGQRLGFGGPAADGLYAAVDDAKFAGKPEEKPASLAGLKVFDRDEFDDFEISPADGVGIEKVRYFSSEGMRSADGDVLLAVRHQPEAHGDEPAVQSLAHVRVSVG